jgi:hypothetical protein
MMTREYYVENDNGKEITTSVKCGADLVIGESFILDIILTSSSAISNKASIELKNCVGIELQGYIPSIVLYDDNKKGIISVELNVDNNVPENNLIQFDIVPNSEAVEFEKTSCFFYTKTLDISSVQLAVGGDYLDVPTGDNEPPDGRYFVKVGTVNNTIKNKDHSAILSGTPVNVLDRSGNKFDEVDFYHTDKKTKIPIRKIGTIGTRRGFIINTDSQGELKFYIYAKKNTPAVLTLYSEIFGSTGAISADKTLYIFNSDQPSAGSIDSLKSPIIIEENNDILYNNGSYSTFTIIIPQYDNALWSDTIFFFINGKMVDKPHLLLNPSLLGTPFIKLPYSIFSEDNEEVNFSYNIIKESASRVISNPISFTYTKNIIPENDAYEKCKVYSSYGVKEINLITESNIVNCRTISNYKNNHNQAGLFVKITGTNDYNDKNKVPLGSEVTIKLHINSKNKIVDKSFGPKKMPLTVGSDSVTNHVIIGIPQMYLVGNDSFNNDDHGKIYFSYSVVINSEKITSKKWKGKIDTVPPDENLDCE